MSHQHICLLPLTEDTKEVYIRLAVEYSLSLSKFFNHPEKVSVINIRSFAEKCLDRDIPYEVDLIYPVNSLPLPCHPIGFITHSKDVIHSSKYFAHFIDEFYITPKYQSKGYGKAAAEKYIFDINQGPVGLFVLKNNEKAAAFWQKVFDGVGYPLKSRPASDEEFEDEKAYLFSTLVH